MKSWISSYRKGAVVRSSSVPAVRFGVAVLSILAVLVAAAASWALDANHPATPGTTKVARITTLDLACPSVTQCTAVGGNRFSGPPSEQFVTFNPGRLAAASPVTAPGAFLTKVACPTARLCVAVGNDIDQWPVITFDPTSSATPAAHPLAHETIGGGLADVACPSPSQCTAMSITGQAYTFDPGAVGSPAPAQVVSAQARLTPTSLACPTTTQCTVAGPVYRAGYAQVATFNPQAPTLTTPVTVVNGAGQLRALSCSSPTRCAALALRPGSSGNFFPSTLVRFDPANPAAASRTLLGPGGGVNMSCPAVSLCVATSTYDYAFDPRGTGQPVVVGPIGTFPAIDCPSVTQCVGIDDAGDAATFVPKPKRQTVKAGTDVKLVQGNVAFPGEGPRPPTKKLTGTLVAASGRTVKTATLKYRFGSFSTKWALGKLKAGSYTVTYKADGAISGTLLLTVRP